MTPRAKRPPVDGFLPLTLPAFHVLVALNRDCAYGYALIRRVADQTDGVVSMSLGTLYGLLGRLLQDGLITEVACPDQADARRRCYRITALGRAVARAEAERLERTVEAARASRLLRPRQA